jgi:hypothetical protein
MRGVCFEGKSGWTEGGGDYTADVKAFLPDEIDTNVGGGTSYSAPRQLVGSTPAAEFTPLYDPPTTDTVTFPVAEYTASVAAINTIIGRLTSPNFGTEAQLGLSSLMVSVDSWHVWWHADPETLTDGAMSSGGNPATASWTVSGSDSKYEIDAWLYCDVHDVWWQYATDMADLAYSATGFTTSASGTGQHAGNGCNNTKLLTLVLNSTGRRMLWGKEWSPVGPRFNTFGATITAPNAACSGDFKVQMGWSLYDVPTTGYEIRLFWDETGGGSWTEDPDGPFAYNGTPHEHNFGTGKQEGTTGDPTWYFKAKLIRLADTPDLVVDEKVAGPYYIRTCEPT